MASVRKLALEDLHDGDSAEVVVTRFRVSTCTIFNWKKKYGGRDSYEDRPRPGRPKTTATPTFMARLAKKLKDDPHTSFREYARHNNISEFTVRKVAKSLGFKSRAVHAVPLLTDRMKENRLHRAKVLLNWLKGH